MGDTLLYKAKEKTETDEASLQEPAAVEDGGGHEKLAADFDEPVGCLQMKIVELPQAHIYSQADSQSNSQHWKWDGI